MIDMIYLAYFTFLMFHVGCDLGNMHVAFHPCVLDEREFCDQLKALHIEDLNCIALHCFALYCINRDSLSFLKRGQFRCYGTGGTMEMVPQSSQRSVSFNLK